MINSNFFNLLYILTSNKVGLRSLELSPEIMNISFEYYSKEENINDRHLLMETMKQISKVPLVQRLGYLVQAIDTTVDMSLPESKHTVNILHLFNHRLHITEKKKNEQRKTIPSYPYILTQKDNNIFVFLDGEVTLNYENGISETLSKSMSLPSYGWAPYKELFRYNINFYTEANTPFKIKNLKIYDENINFNHIDVTVGVMNSNDGENALSFSSTKESMLFIVHGEYDIVSGIDASEGNFDTFKFLNGCDFTIKHKGETHTVAILLEKREL